MNKVEEIRKLPRGMRRAGFVARYARFDEIGARLRQGGRQDEEWDAKEQAEFDAATDELDPWWWAMDREDMRWAGHFLTAGADLCCGGEGVPEALPRGWKPVPADEVMERWGILLDMLGNRSVCRSDDGEERCVPRGAAAWIVQQIGDLTIIQACQDGKVTKNDLVGLLADAGWGLAIIAKIITIIDTK